MTIIELVKEKNITKIFTLYMGSVFIFVFTIFYDDYLNKKY